MTGRPQLKDRLGARHPWGVTRRALNLATTAVPNNETLVIMSWLDWHGGTFTGTQRPCVYPFIVAPTVDQFSIATDGATERINVSSVASGVGQNAQMGTIPLGDNLIAGIVDRDNTKLEGWINNARAVSDGLTKDPDFSASSRSFLLSQAAVPLYAEYTLWRSIYLSLANGSTPSQAQWTEILTYMRDPDAPLHPLLVAAKGTVYSDYYCGEGVDGSATLEDQGDEGDDLTWQGGETCDDVRYRAQTSRRRTRRTFYSLIPPYTATTGLLDFGFAVQPVIFRAIIDKCFFHTAGVQEAVTFAAAADWIRIYTATGGTTNILTRSGGFSKTMAMDENQKNGGDLWIVCEGTDVQYIYSGQVVFNTVLAAPIDMTGNVVLAMDPDGGDVCRVAVWNPATVPAGLLGEIRAACMNPESDPPSLTNKLVDFRLDSERLPLATSTTSANIGTGGGTLTLSAQRDTSCAIVRLGNDP